MIGRTGNALVLAALVAAAGGARAQEDVESPSEEMAPPPPPLDEEQPQQQEAAALTPPAQEPTEQQFDAALSPHGRWVDTPEYGRVWQPSGVAQDWQPYTDGQWVDTSYGWSFQASVPWGWATYHYGRWGWRPAFGWYWVPGYRWAPAWVAWRHANGYAIWSPLAPRGYVYGRTWPGWVAVPHQHFRGAIHHWAVPSTRLGGIVRSGRPVRGFGSVRYARPVQPVQRRVTTPQPGHRVEPRRH